MIPPFAQVPEGRFPLSLDGLRPRRLRRRVSVAYVDNLDSRTMSRPLPATRRGAYALFQRVGDRPSALRSPDLASLIRQ